MADKKKLKMGQFAYDLKTNKAVFKIGTETYDVFPIDTELSETSNNPVSNAVITKKIKEIEEGGGSGYVLPPATAEKLGGIKVGDGLTITSDGTLSAHGGETPITITIDKALDKTSENAIANKPVAEKFEQIDKAIENITPYELPKASTETLGGIKVGQNLTIDENGVLNAIGGEASSADKVTYDNTSSKIEAINVQEAIDYLVEQNKGKEEITSKIYTMAVPGIIDQSSYLNDNFAGYKAFNGQSATISTCQGGWLSTAEDTTPWISYNFEQKVILTKIAIEACNNSTTISKDYKVQGSLDGIIYEDITEINITFEQGKLTPYIFNINSNKAYQYFRILGSSPNYGGVNLYACTFSQIKLYAKKEQGEKDTPIAADVAYDDSVSSIGVTNVQEAIDYLVEHGGGGGSGGDLQPATTETLGGIIVGNNLEITKEGILSAVAAPYDLPIASNEVLGGIKVGQNLTIDENGVLNAEAGGASSATDVTYDDTITQIGVNNVQAAIEYLKVHGGGGTSADFYTYDETMAILNEKSGGDEPDMICGIFSDVEEAYIIEESILGIFKEETENE